MKVLITGSRGFVGVATKEYLQEKEVEIVDFDLMDKQDIRDREQFDSFVNATMPDRILHLAAIARFAEADKDPKLAFETNVVGTKNVVAIARKFKIPLVFASTGSVYMPVKRTPPITEDFEACGNSVYGCSKYLGECYVRENSPHIILRYAHLYGKEKRMHGLIGGFVERISRGLAPTLYGGKQSNDFTYIKDVAKANYLALTAPWDKWNQAYNIGTGEELTAEAAGQAICEALQWPKDKVEIKEARTVDPMNFVYDMSKAEKMLNFKAEYKFLDGLKDMFSEMKEV